MNEDNASYMDINGGMLYFILIYFLLLGTDSLADTSPSNIMFLLYSILLTNTYYYYYYYYYYHYLKQRSDTMHKEFGENKS